MGPQNENAPSSTWAAMVPEELNDVLREQAPGVAQQVQVHAVDDDPRRG